MITRTPAVLRPDLVGALGLEWLVDDKTVFLESYTDHNRAFIRLRLEQEGVALRICVLPEYAVMFACYFAAEALVASDFLISEVVLKRLNMTDAEVPAYKATLKRLRDYLN